MIEPTYVNDGEDPFAGPSKVDLTPKTDLQRQILAAYAKHHVKRFKNIEQLNAVKRIERRIASKTPELAIDPSYVQWVINWVKGKLALNQYIPIHTLISMCMDVQRQNEWKAKQGKVIDTEETLDYGNV